MMCLMLRNREQARSHRYSANARFRRVCCFTEKNHPHRAITMNRNDLRRVDMNLLVIFETLMFEKNLTLSLIHI